MSATIVLVHGAWHGAWCWDPVAAVLRHRGYDVVALDLPGHGSDPGPFQDLHGDANSVRSALETIDGEVVLVGHSYGGAVVTEAGTHPAVARLVYLAAFCIDEHESCAAALHDDPEAAAISHAGRPDLGDVIVLADDGTCTLTREGAAECLYNDCDPTSTEWALDRIGAQPMVNLTQSPAVAAWRTQPSTYVVCEDDQTVHPELQTLLARRCEQVERWPLDHSPFLSDPDRVAAMLTALAERQSGSSVT